MNKKGFTLIEIMIVLAIFGVLMIAGSDMLINVLQNSAKSVTQNEVRQNANKIMQDITSQLRVSLVTGTNPWTINNNVYSLDTSTHVLSKNSLPITTDKINVSSLSISCPSECNISLTVTDKNGDNSYSLTNTIVPRQY